jgi:hypothetical protein
MERPGDVGKRLIPPQLEWVLVGGLLIIVLGCLVQGLVLFFDEGNWNVSKINRQLLQMNPNNYYFIPQSARNVQMQGITDSRQLVLDLTFDASSREALEFAGQFCGGVM